MANMETIKERRGGGKEELGSPHNKIHVPLF
jgi:hypothetical protein